ncbi:MAG: GH116 family glycosyl hydrolase, partial [Rhodothermales bacterium]|nr:GH116 family glycosyl hydrolase [Rhodothermales bacterium]
LLDVDSVRPLLITGTFRPDLRLMWPAGLMTGNLGWDAPNERYFIVEETGSFAGVIGAPGAQDVSVMPYQEEPQDVPTRFVLQTDPDAASSSFYPIVVAGSVEGRTAAEAVYERLLAEAETQYRQTVDYYADLLGRTVSVRTPDERLNTALDWARIGMDKGFVDNPTVGTGLVAGFRTSGASERPGFAWFFGRDALWTVFALIATGNYEDARTAIDFLKSVQRADGKVPHEISQSAAYLPWFKEYSYPWNSADATPLFIIANADLWRATGDDRYLRSNWPALVAAYRFTAGTDTDGNRLVENTRFGHGWVEGGELYPAHEEIYMQGLWIQAASDMVEMAFAIDEFDIASEASRAAEATRVATEARYWQEQDGYYAFATKSSRPSDLYLEDTVLPAVPLWWGTLDADRAQRQIDRLGSGALATDWGTRILSERSKLYDPLSYHNGSVWPLFTGWASMAAYRYDRAHVGYQALMANALLTFQDALGYVTELLSGRFNTAFGRSSHHQVWSEAMVSTPAVRGMLGLAVANGGRIISFKPQIPANWPFVEVDNVRVRDRAVSIRFERTAEGSRAVFTAADGQPLPPLRVAPGLPLDASVREVTVDGVPTEFDVATAGDLQRVLVEVAPAFAETEIVFQHSAGTDVAIHQSESIPGDINRGLRIIRSRAGESSLDLTVEGIPNTEYELILRTDRTPGDTDAPAVQMQRLSDLEILLRYVGAGGYRVSGHPVGGAGHFRPIVHLIAQPDAA